MGLAKEGLTAWQEEITDKLRNIGAEREEIEKFVNDILSAVDTDEFWKEYENALLCTVLGFMKGCLPEEHIDCREFATLVNMATRPNDDVMKYACCEEDCPNAHGEGYDFKKYTPSRFEVVVDYMCAKPETKWIKDYSDKFGHIAWKTRRSVAVAALVGLHKYIVGQACS